MFRTCLDKICVRIFERNFVSDKEKIRRHTDVLQEFLTQSMAKFAEKRVHYLVKTGSWKGKSEWKNL